MNATRGDQTRRSRADRRIGHGWLAAVAAAALACSACGAGTTPAQAPTTTTPTAKAAPLFRGQPQDYVPSAGLRWLVTARPAELLADKALRDALKTLIPDERLYRFTTSSGVNPSAVSAAAIAGFDYATLYLAVVGAGDALVEEKFIKRLLSAKKRQHPHPELWRITGIVGETPQTLVRVDQHLIGVSVGDPTPAKVVDAFARRKLKKSLPALQGAALKQLPAELSEAPLCFYAPGPFNGEWMEGAHGLLAHAVAVGVGMRPLSGRNAGVGRFTLYLSGDWEAVGPDSTARLMDAWDELSSSSTGALFGLDRLTAKPIVSASKDLLKLEIDVNIARLLGGLHAAVAADVNELMRLDPTPAAKPDPL